MKSKFGFIGMGLILCFVPAVVYLASPDHSREVFGDLPGTMPKATGPISMENQGYRVSMEPIRAPLKTGKQSLRVSVTQQGKPVLKTPNIQVTMPMGTSIMTAPVQVSPMQTAGDYEVETDFSMGGDWQLEIKSSPAQNVVLKFWIQG